MFCRLLLLTRRGRAGQGQLGRPTAFSHVTRLCRYSSQLTAHFVICGGQRAAGSGHCTLRTVVSVVPRVPCRAVRVNRKYRRPQRASCAFIPDGHGAPRESRVEIRDSSPDFAIRANLCRWLFWRRCAISVQRPWAQALFLFSFLSPLRFLS